MELRVNHELTITELRPTDRSALVEHLQEEEIQRHTLLIPFPYQEADADAFLALAARLDSAQTAAHLAIRRADGLLIGGCGVTRGAAPYAAHRGELGYWLARPYWGGGRMTAVVGRLCRYAFDELGFRRLTAAVYSFNDRSRRVLEKNGFRREATYPRHYLKHGRFIDAHVYGLLGPE